MPAWSSRCMPTDQTNNEKTKAQHRRHNFISRNMSLHIFRINCHIFLRFTRIIPYWPGMLFLFIWDKVAPCMLGLRVTYNLSWRNRVARRERCSSRAYWRTGPVNTLLLPAEQYILTTNSYWTWESPQWVSDLWTTFNAVFVHIYTILKFSGPSTTGATKNGLSETIRFFRQDIGLFC